EPHQEPPRDGWRDQRVTGRDGPDRLDEVLGSDVLQKEAAGASTKRLYDVISGVEGRQDDHTGITDTLLGNESSGRLEAIHHGHADVHDDQLGADAAHALRGVA